MRKIKDGERIAILGYGPVLSMAFAAAHKFHEMSQLDASIFSVHTLKPLDRKRIASILLSNERVIILEEAIHLGGLGMQVKAIAWDIGAKVKIRCLGLQDKFIKCYGTKDELLEAHGISEKLLIQQFGN